MNGDTDFEARYLSGRELYGDDFSQEQIEEWFESEREGYADLGSSAADGNAGPGGYWYHFLNERQGYRHLPKGKRFHHALGLGSAYGLEFEPIADRINKLSILEPSDQLVGTDVGGLTPEYVKPQPSGTMPFADSAFDLVVCLGTLHHIPNVTHVVSEIGRVLEPGGHTVIREPIVSMGDWRTDRGSAVTEKERGIPLKILRRQIRDAGLTIKYQGYSSFPPVFRLIAKYAPNGAYNTPWVTRADTLAARLARPMYRYHATRTWQKFRPCSLSVVAMKPPLRSIG